MPRTYEAKCQECGKLFTAKGWERAEMNGCPGCGGGDIDLLVVPIRKD